MPRRNLYVLTIVTLVSLACYFRADRSWQLLAFAMDQVGQRALETTDRHKLVEGALGGMMKQLDDDHSIYISPRMLARFKERMDGEFEGIGIKIMLDPETRQITVASPIFGSPAEQAGLRARDRILQIDGKSTNGMSLQDALELMRGKKDTAVVLMIQHAGEETPAEVRIVRKAVQDDTVIGESRNPQGAWSYILKGHPGIGYVRITTFGERTAEELKGILERLADDGMRGLVIDLRDDLGGLLRTAIDVCNMFIDSGVIVTT
ncbi:MAG: S41 family peptidase, partial [Candidatus Aminicenantales bacterium]